MEWQWQGDQGQWELYSEDAQQALSEAYSSIPGRQLLQRRPGPGQPSVVQLVFTLPASPQHAQPKQQMYEMDFFSRPMVQRNVGSGKQRSIRLVAAVPPVDRLSLPTRIQEPQPEGAPAADEQDSSAADDIGASAASSAHRARRIEIYTEHRPRKVQDVDQLLEPEPELELEPELESGGAGAAAEVREELLEIYMRSQPEKVANVDRLMRQWLDYGHSIHELLGTVRAKFAPVEDDDGSEAAAGAEPAHELAVAVQPGGEQQAPVLESGNQQSGREDAEQLFAIFDVDQDGVLSEFEYQTYLHGTGLWTTHCTDPTWQAYWLSECDALDQSNGVGIGRTAFVEVLYGKHRLGKAGDDLDTAMMTSPPLSKLPVRRSASSSIGQSELADDDAVATAIATTPEMSAGEDLFAMPMEQWQNRLGTAVRGILDQCQSVGIDMPLEFIVGELTKLVKQAHDNWYSGCHQWYCPLALRLSPNCQQWHGCIVSVPLSADVCAELSMLPDIQSDSPEVTLFVPHVEVFTARQRRFARIEASRGNTVDSLPYIKVDARTSSGDSEFLVIVQLPVGQKASQATSREPEEGIPPDASDSSGKLDTDYAAPLHQTNVVTFPGEAWCVKRTWEEWQSLEAAISAIHSLQCTLPRSASEPNAASVLQEFGNAVILFVFKDSSVQVTTQKTRQQFQQLKAQLDIFLFKTDSTESPQLTAWWEHAKRRLVSQPAAVDMIALAGSLCRAAPPRLTAADATAWFAVQQGDAELLRGAARCGTDVNCRGFSNSRPGLLHEAARLGHISCAMVLLQELNVDLRDMRDASGRTAEFHDSIVQERLDTAVDENRFVAEVEHFRRQADKGEDEQQATGWLCRWRSDQLPPNFDVGFVLSAAKTRYRSSALITIFQWPVVGDGSVPFIQCVREELVFVRPVSPVELHLCAAYPNIRVPAVSPEMQTKSILWWDRLVSDDLGAAVRACTVSDFDQSTEPMSQTCCVNVPCAETGFGMSISAGGRVIGFSTASPARTAGIPLGSKIVAVGGKAASVKNTIERQLEPHTLRVGAKVPIEFVADQQTKQLDSAIERTRLYLMASLAGSAESSRQVHAWTDGALITVECRKSDLSSLIAENHHCLPTISRVPDRFTCFNCSHAEILPRLVPGMVVSKIDTWSTCEQVGTDVCGFPAFPAWKSKDVIIEKLQKVRDLLLREDTGRVKLELWRPLQGQLYHAESKLSARLMYLKERDDVADHVRSFALQEYDIGKYCSLGKQKLYAGEFEQSAEHFKIATTTISTAQPHDGTPDRWDVELWLWVAQTYIYLERRELSAALKLLEDVQQTASYHKFLLSRSDTGLEAGGLHVQTDGLVEAVETASAALHTAINQQLMQHTAYVKGQVQCGCSGANRLELAVHKCVSGINLIVQRGSLSVARIRLVRAYYLAQEFSNWNLWHPFVASATAHLRQASLLCCRHAIGLRDTAAVLCYSCALHSLSQIPRVESFSTGRRLSTVSALDADESYSRLLRASAQLTTFVKQELEVARQRLRRAGWLHRSTARAQQMLAVADSEQALQAVRIAESLLWSERTAEDLKRIKDNAISCAVNSLEMKCDRLKAAAREDRSSTSWLRQSAVELREPYAQVIGVLDQIASHTDASRTDSPVTFEDVQTCCSDVRKARDELNKRFKAIYDDCARERRVRMQMTSPESLDLEAGTVGEEALSKLKRRRNAARRELVRCTDKLSAMEEKIDIQFEAQEKILHALRSSILGISSQLGKQMNALCFCQRQAVLHLKWRTQMKRFEEVKGWIKTGHKFTDVVVRFEGHAQVVVVDVALAFESHVNAVKQVYRRFDIRKDVFTHGTNDTSIPEQWRATSVVVNPGTDESLVLLGNADQLCSRINRRIRLLELEASRQPAAELSPWSNENSETGPRCIRALSEPHCLAETHKVCTKAQTLLQRWDQVVDRSSVQEGSDYNMSAAVQSIRTLQSAGPEHDTETILAMLNSAQSSVQRAQEFVNAELALSGVSLATMWRLVAHGIVDPYLICIGPRNLSTSAVHFLATHDASKPRVELSMVQEQFLSQAGQSKPVQLFPGCRMVAVQGVTDTPRTAFKCGRLSLEVTPKTMRLSASQEEGMLTVEGSELSWKPQVHGSYDSSASLAGASVGMPKSARKLPYTFRVDLAQPDSDGRSKYILAAPSSVEFDEWIQVLRAAACCGQSTPRVSSTGAVHAPDEFEPELESEPDSAVSLHWYLSEIRRRFSDPEHNCAVTCLAVQCLQDGLREMLGQSGNFISLAETAQRARALLLAERQKIKNERNAIRADGVLQRAEEVRPLLNSQTPSFGTLDSLHEQKLAQQDKLDNALLTLKQATRRNKQTDEHRVAVDEAKRQLSGTVRKLTQEMRRLYAHAEMDWPELLHNEKLPDVSERFQGLPGFQGVEVCAAQGWNRSLYSDMRKIADGRNTVYKAVRVDDGREVVLKEVKIDSNLDKLEREVALLVKLRHPNIVQVEACFKDEASLFIQMPLYRGGNLRSWLVFNLEDFRGDKHLRERRRKILADILLAVHRVHSLDGGGSVHNDIKLSNVLLTDGHTSAVLIDFETAQDRSRQRTGVTTTQHHAVGTHAYMAPERLVDSDHPDSAIEGSWSTDMYSVGVVLLLAFSPELIDRVEGGQEIPNKALDEVREQLEHSYGWLPQLLNDPLAGTGLLTDPLLADGSGAETALPMPPDASPLASRRNATESYRASGPSPRRLFPEGRRKRARQILDMEYFKAGATTALPPHWTQQSGSEHGYTLVPLDESDPTVHTLRHMVAETRPDDFGKGLDSGAEWQRAGLQEGNRHVQFVRAWRLENTVLWKQYQARVERTNADLSRGPALDALPAARRSGPIRAALREGGQSLEGGLRPECAECFLMHGCPIDNLGNILANGLDQGFAGTNAGNAFGVGIYFAEDIEKCDQYTRCPAKKLKSAQLEALAPLFQTLYGGDECAEHDDVLFILVCRATMGYSIRTTGYDIPMDGRELGKTAPTQPRDPSCPSPGSKSIFHQPRTRKKLIGVVDPITKDVIQPLLHHHSLIAEKGVRIQRFREFVLFDGSSVYPEYVVAYRRAPQPTKLEPEPEPESM